MIIKIYEAEDTRSLDLQQMHIVHRRIDKYVKTLSVILPYITDLISTS